MDSIVVNLDGDQVILFVQESTLGATETAAATAIGAAASASASAVSAAASAAASASAAAVAAVAATAGKVNRVGDTFTGPVGAPETKVGNDLLLATSGGDPAPPFVVSFSNFEFAPTSEILQTSEPTNPLAAYANDSVDVRHTRPGYGKDYFDKVIIQSDKRTFGWFNEAIDFAILSNAPADGQVWVDNLGVYRKVAAEILGAIPPNVVAVYEGGFESLCGFFRNFGTEKREKPVTSYGQFTVTFATALADDEFYPSMFYETNHVPPFRGQGQTISGDRRTVTMHSWYRAGGKVTPSGTPTLTVDGSPLSTTGYTSSTAILVSPAPGSLEIGELVTVNSTPPCTGRVTGIFSNVVTVSEWMQSADTSYGQIPTGTPDCKINPNYQAYIFNSIAQLDDERWVLAATPATGVTGGTSLGNWNASTNSPTITSSVGTLNNYYTVSVAGTTTINGVSSWAVGDRIRYNGTAWVKVIKVRARDQEEVFTTWEIGLLNNRGAQDYNGDYVLTGLKAQTGRKNFVCGIDVVDNGTWGSAYGFRVRGRTFRGYVSRDQEDGGFVVEPGLLGLTKFGFRTEDNSPSFVPFQVATLDDVKWQVLKTGDMDIGSKTISGQKVWNWFTAGSANPDAQLIVSGGDGTTDYKATMSYAAAVTQFLGFDGTPQFRVNTTASATDYTEITGSASAGGQFNAISTNANSNIQFNPKGTGAVIVNAAAGATALLVVGGGANRLNLNSTGFVFGPTGTEWLGFASSALTVGPTADPWVFANTSGVVLTRTTNIARVGSGAYSVLVTPMASAVNTWDFRGAPTGNGVRVLATGTDTNIDIQFVPKGTGLLYYESSLAGVAATVPGNFVANRVIPIKTPSGTFYVPAALAAW